MLFREISLCIHYNIMYLMKIPCCLHWSNHVVSCVYYSSWYVSDFIYIVQQVLWIIIPTIVNKIMTIKKKFKLHFKVFFKTFQFLQMVIPNLLC